VDIEPPKMQPDPVPHSQAVPEAGPGPTGPRIEPGSVNLPPHPWPATTHRDDDDIDPAAVAQSLVDALNAALAEADCYPSLLAGLFADGGFWRDHLALSWGLRTLKGREGILAFLLQQQQQQQQQQQEEEGQEKKKGKKKQCTLTKVELDASSEFKKPQIAGFRPGGGNKGGQVTTGINFFTVITTVHGTGRGVVRLIETEAAAAGGWKVWTMYTVLEGLAGFEERVGPRRPVGVEHGGRIMGPRRSWAERRAEEMEMEGGEVDVLIIGMCLSPCPNY